MMEDFNSETDSDYTSYWRDWVSLSFFLCFVLLSPLFPLWVTVAAGECIWGRRVRLRSTM